MSLPYQRGDVFLFKKKLIKPRNLRKHLQISKILRLEISLRAIRIASLLPKPVPQFFVARLPANYVPRIRLEQILQPKTPLILRQIFRGSGRNPQEGILRRSRGIILYLHHQRWNKIEILVNVGKFIQQLHHAVVVLERMQSNPRQTVFTRDQILVKRLVLMPEKYDSQGRHEMESASLARDITAAGPHPTPSDDHFMTTL